MAGPGEDFRALVDEVWEWQRESYPMFASQLGDKRFEGPSWQEPPFNLFHQGFLLTQRWWHNATHQVAGVSPHHETVVSFIARQMLDVFSPSNFVTTNPELLEATRNQAGMNLFRGVENWIQDLQGHLEGPDRPRDDSYLPGRDVAVSRSRAAR